MSRKTFVYAGSALVALIGVFAISPYWSIAGLYRAAMNDNPDAVADYVDFERLRQNLKGQVVTAMQPELAKASSDGRFAALGAALGTMFVDRMIDSFVTPEAISQAIKAGVGDADRSRVTTTFALIGRDAGDWVDTSTFRMRGENGTSFTWRRNGLSWRLTSMGLDGRSEKPSSVPASTTSQVPSGYIPTPASEAIASARKLLAEGKAMEAYGLAHTTLGRGYTDPGERRELEQIAAEAWARQRGN